MAEVSLKIRATTEKRELQEAQRSLQALEAAQRGIVDAFERGEVGYDGVRAALRALAESYEDVEGSAKAYRRTLAEVQDIENRRQNQRFDDVSQRVGLAGDVQSNLGAISGLASAGGATGLASGIGAAGEVAALVEELPRLKTALQGLPSTIGAAISALGPAGIAAAVGLGAVALAFSELNREAQENADRITRNFDAFRQLSLEIANGLTTDEINERLTQRQAQLEAEKRILDGLESEYDNYINNLGVAAAGVRVVSNEEQARVQAIEDQRRVLQQAEDDITGLTGALESSAVAANDAAQAAREYGNSLVEQAANDTELRRLSQRASDFTQEQLDAERENLQQRRELAQAELQQLQGTGNESEVVTQRIGQLETQLSSLDDQLGLLSSSSVQAAAATNTAAQAQEQAIQALTRAQDQYTQAVDRAQDALSNRRQDIRRGRGDRLADIALNTERELADLRTDARREELKAERDQQRELEQIRRDALREEQDAARERNFLALADAREGLSERTQDLREEAQIERQERQLQFEQARQDQTLNARRARSDAQTAANRQLRDARIAQQRQLDQARSALEAQISTQRQAYNQTLRDAQQWAMSFSDIVSSAFNGASPGQGGGFNGGSDPFVTQSQLEFVLAG